MLKIQVVWFLSVSPRAPDSMRTDSIVKDDGGAAGAAAH